MDALWLEKLGLINGSGGDPGQDYADLLIDTYLANEVWRPTAILSGTTIPAQVASARDGTLTGWTLQNGTSPVAGEALKSPFSDGDNDYGNLYTASLASLFDGAEGGFFGWAQVTDSAVWTDTEWRALLNVRVDANNGVLLRKTSAASAMQCVFSAGGTASAANVSSFNPTDWFSYAVTWSVSRNEVMFYLNATQYATSNPPGTWVGTLTSAVFGAESSVPGRVWDGWLAYLAFWAGYAPTAANVAAMHAAAG